VHPRLPRRLPRQNTGVSNALPSSSTLTTSGYDTGGYTRTGV
jgi:hypothetical protein